MAKPWLTRHEDPETAAAAQIHDAYVSRQHPDLWVHVQVRLKTRT